MKLSKDFTKFLSFGLPFFILGITPLYLIISWVIWYEWLQGAYPQMISILGMIVDAFIITRIFFRYPVGKIWNLIMLFLISGMSISKWYFSFWYWRLQDCSFCRWDIPFLSAFIFTFVEVVIVMYAIKLVYLLKNIPQDKIPINLPTIIICFYILFMIDGIWQYFYIAFNRFF